MHDSFEQLCINYANEVLQSLFNDHVFKRELQDYKEEGIDVSAMKAPNNQPCVDLIGTTNAKQFISIFNLLDDKSNAKKEQSDTALLKIMTEMYVYNSDALTKRGKKNASYFDIQHKRHEQPKTFSILHFAGAVQYSIADFITKNSDKFPAHLEAVMVRSQSGFVSGLFDGDAGGADDDGKKRKKKKRKGGRSSRTIASTFRGQLNSLTKLLNSTEPHFIRCIKPNSRKLNCDGGPSAFEAPKVLSQLLFSGVMETVKIRQLGYPYRKKFGQLWNYLVKARVPKLLGFGMIASVDARDGCERVATALLEPEAFKIGNTMFFSKDGFEQRVLAWQERTVATRLQQWIRFQSIKAGVLSSVGPAVHELQTRWRRRRLQIHYQALTSSIQVAQVLARACLAAAGVQQKIDTSRARRQVEQALRAKVLFDDWSRLALSVALHRRKSIASSLQVLIRSTLACTELRSQQNRRRALTRSANLVQTMARCLFAGAEYHHNIQGFKRLELLKTKLSGTCLHGTLIIRVLQARARHKVAVARQFIASGLLTACRRRFFLFLRQAAGKIQRLFRRYKLVRYIARRKLARLGLQSFGRLVIAIAKFWRCKSAARRIQRNWRRFCSRRNFQRFLHRIRWVQVKFLRPHLRQRLGDWFYAAEAAIFGGNLSLLTKLVTCQVAEFSSLWEFSNLVNFQDRVRGTTCLHAAVRCRNFGMVQFLVRNGARANIQDAYGDTPLHVLAAGNGDEVDLHIAKYLLATTAPRRAAASIVATKNGAGKLPIDIALSCEEPSPRLQHMLHLQMAIDAPETLKGSFSPPRGGHRMPVETANHRQQPGFQRKYSASDADELVPMQLVSLNSQVTIDPTTLFETRRRHNRAVVAIQSSFRRWRQQTRYRQRIATEAQQRAVVQKTRERNAANARLEQMRKRQQVLQQRLKDGRRLFDLDPASTNGEEKSPETTTPRKTAPLVTPSKVARCDSHPGSTTTVSLNVLQQLAQSAEARRQRHFSSSRGRVSQQQPTHSHQQPDETKTSYRPDSFGPVSSSGGGQRGSVVGASVANSTDSESVGHHMQQQQHQTIDKGSGTDADSLRDMVFEGLQCYWEVMAVRRWKEPHWWYRRGPLGKIQGPISTAQLETMQRSPEKHHRVECRHSGMLQFVLLTEFRELRPPDDGQQSLIQLKRALLFRLATPLQ